MSKILHLDFYKRSQVPDPRQLPDHLKVATVDSPAEGYAIFAHDGYVIAGRITGSKKNEMYEYTLHAVTNGYYWGSSEAGFAVGVQSDDRNATIFHVEPIVRQALQADETVFYPVLTSVPIDDDTLFNFAGVVAPSPSQPWVLNDYIVSLRPVVDHRSEKEKSDNALAAVTFFDGRYHILAASGGMRRGPGWPKNDINTEFVVIGTHSGVNVDLASTHVITGATIKTTSLLTRTGEHQDGVFPPGTGTYDLTVAGYRVPKVDLDVVTLLARARESSSALSMLTDGAFIETSGINSGGYALRKNQRKVLLFKSALKPAAQARYVDPVDGISEMAQARDGADIVYLSQQAFNNQRVGGSQQVIAENAVVVRSEDGRVVSVLPHGAPAFTSDPRLETLAFLIAMGERVTIDNNGVMWAGHTLFQLNDAEVSAQNVREILGLRDANRDLQAKLDTALADVNARDGIIQQGSNRVAELERTVNEQTSAHNEVVRQKDEEIAGLRGELLRYQGQSGAADELSRELDLVRSQLETANNDLADLRRSAQSTGQSQLAEIAGLREELREAKATKEELATEVTEKSKEIISLRSELTVMQSSANASSEEVGRLNTRISELEAELAAGRDGAVGSDVEEQLDRAIEKADRLEQHLREVEAERDDLRSRVGVLTEGPSSASSGPILTGPLVLAAVVGGAYFLFKKRGRSADVHEHVVVQPQTSQTDEMRVETNNYTQSQTTENIK